MQVNTVAAAYNQSIYTMLIVPYTLLGMFGYLIYRGMRKNEKFRDGHSGGPIPVPPDAGGERSPAHVLFDQSP